MARIEDYELVDILIALALWADARAGTGEERQQVWQAFLKAIRRPL